MLRIIITGAAGRMGRRLVANLAEDPALELAGATEYPGSSLIGADAGELAGAGVLGVKIVPSLEEAFANGGKVDAVIDFSTGAVVDNAKLAAEKGAGIVIGTTALTAEQKAELHALADNGARIVQTYNYSVGVNLLFYLSGIAADILSEDFDIEIIEAHHNQKKDAPSGTAFTTAEAISEALGGKEFVHGREGLCPRGKEIGIHAVRGGDIVGDHTAMFIGNCERIEIKHQAHSREVFIAGAVLAAKWVCSQEKGKIYSMKDVLA